MIKLKDLLTEDWWSDLDQAGQAAYIKAHPQSQKAQDANDDSEKKSVRKASQPGLGAGSKNLTGPKSKEDALGDDPKKEASIVQGIKAMAEKNRGKHPKDQDKSVDIGDEETTNLCDVTVPGTNIFCADSKGIPRAKMPQLKSKPWKKGEGEPWVYNEKTGQHEPTKFEETDEEYAQRVPASKLPKDGQGEVNTEDAFKRNLEAIGVKMSEPKPMSVRDMKATQNELKPANVAFMVDVLMNATPPPHKDEEAEKKWKLSEKLREPVIVSKDGYILDGHHRWGALVALDIANGGTGEIEMNVKMVDAGVEELVEKTREFTDKQGLQTKPAEKKKKKESIIRMMDLLNGR